MATRRSHYPGQLAVAVGGLIRSERLQWAACKTTVRDSEDLCGFRRNPPYLHTTTQQRSQLTPLTLIPILIPMTRGGSFQIYGHVVRGIEMPAFRVGVSDAYG